MDVVVDVIGTVAVIAVALGAVTKFLVGVVGVGLAADGALVDIALLLLGLLYFLFREKADEELLIALGLLLIL